MKTKLIKSMLAMSCIAASSAQATQIDVGVFYTQEAKNSVPGQDINTKINHLMANANRAYRNSGIDLKINLAQTELYSKNPTAEPVEADLISLKDDRGIKRNAYKLDMVALMGTSFKITREGRNLIACGLGYVGWGNNGQLAAGAKDYMYSISAIDCGASTFVHELGHNMGLAHSRKQDDTKGGVYVDGMGHGQDNSFATIMAYPHVFAGDVTHLNRFSDPSSRDCNGYECGVWGQSNAVKTINATKNTIANYYVGSTPPPSSSECEGIAQYNPSTRYQVGDKVIYQNYLYELTRSRWSPIKSCS